MADFNVNLNINTDKLSALLGMKVDAGNIENVIENLFGDGISNVSVGQDANASPNMGFGDDFISSDCLGQTQTDIYSVPSSYVEDPNAIDYEEVADSLVGKNKDLDPDAIMTVLYSGKYSSEDIVNIMKAYQDKTGHSIEEDLRYGPQVPWETDVDTRKALAEGFKNAREDYAKNNPDNKLTDEQVKERAIGLFKNYDDTSKKHVGTLGWHHNHTYGVNEENLQKFLYDETISSGDKLRILNAYKEMHGYGASLKNGIVGEFSGKTEHLYLEKLEELEKELGY